MGLFQPNNLSRTRPEFLPVNDAALRAEVETLLRDAYEFSDLQNLSIARFEGANISSQNLKVSTKAADWFLKSRDNTGRDRFVAEVQLNQELLDVGQPVPRIIPASTGSLTHSDEWKTWALYEFQEGNYFAGNYVELGAAARSFGKLTLAAKGLSVVAEDIDLSGEVSFLDDLQELLLPDFLNNSGDHCLIELCTEHRQTILENIEGAREYQSLLTGARLPLHLDYHPLNLLMKQGQVVCILDLEHLSYYPVVAGLGFAAYKLIRQAMVNPEFRSQELGKPVAVRRWIDAWQESFPDYAFTSAELGVGARFRILKLIHLIVESSVKRGENRSNYDLPKQIHSLYEADVVFHS